MREREQGRQRKGEGRERGENRKRENPRRQSQCEGKESEVAKRKRTQEMIMWKSLPHWAIFYIYYNNYISYLGLLNSFMHSGKPMPDYLFLLGVINVWKGKYHKSWNSLCAGIVLFICFKKIPREGLGETSIHQAEKHFQTSSPLEGTISIVCGPHSLTH